MPFAVSSAGFATVFGTPIAGAFSDVEVLVLAKDFTRCPFSFIGSGHHRLPIAKFFRFNVFLTIDSPPTVFPGSLFIWKFIAESFTIFGFVRPFIGGNV